MPRLLTNDDVRTLLDAERIRAGNLRNLGKEWGISHAYISDVINGKKDPRALILARLGLRVEPRYSRIGTQRTGLTVVL